jgi:hypothetical protein
MKIGSMAIAVTAAYGEWSFADISFSGSTCRKSKPASFSHAATSGISEISPEPQLSLLGAANNGSSTPACRPLQKRFDGIIRNREVRSIDRPTKPRFGVHESGRGTEPQHPSCHAALRR